MGVFCACPGSTVGPSAGLPKDQKGLLQGSNREFSPIPPFCAKNRLENHCESNSLPDQPQEIACAAEQGINSTGTGNPIFENRELIRHNRESGAKSRRPYSRQMPSPSWIKKLSTMGDAKQPSPQIKSVRALHFHGDHASREAPIGAVSRNRWSSDDLGATAAEQGGNSR